MQTILQMMQMMAMLSRREEGQSLAEYGLIMALVVVGAILALSTLGDNIASFMNEVAGGFTQ